MPQIDYKTLSDTTLLVNGQPLIAQRYTVNGEPWVRYQGAKPSTSGEPLYVNSNGNEYFFETYNPEGGHQEYDYIPVFGSYEDLQNKNKSQEVYTRAYGNDKPKQKFGGTMNYASYLQGGGTTPQSESSQISKDQIAELITAALLGTGEMKQQASEILQSMLQDSSIAPLVEQVMEEMGVPMQKCGGRVKKKALGSKITPKKIMAKGGCPCMIKKVGGRLIEVDSCTGLPIHRNGAAIKKFEKPAGVLEKDDFGYTYNGKSYTRGTEGTWYTSAIPKDLNSYTKIFDANLIKELNSAYNKAGFDYSTEEQMHQNKNYYLDKTGRNTWYRWSPTGSLLYIKSNWFDDGVNGLWADVEGGLSGIKDVNLKQLLVNRRPNASIPEYSPIKGSLSRFSKTGDFTNIYGLYNGKYYSNYGAADAQWDQTKGTWTKEGFNYDPNKGWTKLELEQPARENPQKDPVKTWRDTFGAGKAGKFGGKTYDEALALQNEMLNADWFDANLGTSGTTKRGDDGMWGATSQKEYARYLAEKQRREEQAAAAAAAEAEKQELNNLQASSIRRTTSDGMTNEALLAMDAVKAMSTLSRPDYERWTKLNQHQQGRNASLVYNGKRYDDETAYNAAVDAETERTTPQLDMQALLNTRGKRKRNAIYNQYLASMDKHVANNPLYSGPKALTQEQLSATSFKNGGQLNYANYLN